MKLLHKIIIGTPMFLIVTIPFLFPKYPEYPVVLKTYEWGQIKIRTSAYLDDQKSNTGSIDVAVTFFPNSLTSKKCVLKLIKFKAQPQSNAPLGGGIGTGATDDYWNERLEKKQSVFMSAVYSETAQLSEIDLSIKIKVGEYCEAQNSIITIDEKLPIKMRYNTLWGFLFDLMMSV